jgi:hypothetical protein
MAAAVVDSEDIFVRARLTSVFGRRQHVARANAYGEI